MKVLLVEDNRQSARLFIRLLTGAGYEVEHTIFGQEALDMARDTAFDAVLLDFDLPDMDGTHVGELLRFEQASLPIVAITSDGSRATRRKAELLGFNAFIPKPIDVELFINTMQKLMPAKAPWQSAPCYFGMSYIVQDQCRV